MPDTVIISNLPSHTPSGSDYLAVEDSSQTGKSTVNDVVGASSSVATINAKIGSTALPTTAQTLTGAIAEHESDISTLNSNLTGEIIDATSGAAFQMGDVLFTAGFNNFKYVDLTFSFQGVILSTVRLLTNYNSEYKYGLNLGFINTTDGGLRQIVGTFTNAGRYLGSLTLSMGAVANATGTTQTWSDISSSGTLKLVRAIGYPARS